VFRVGVQSALTRCAFDHPLAACSDAGLIAFAPDHATPQELAQCVPAPGLAPHIDGTPDERAAKSVADGAANPTSPSRDWILRAIHRRPQPACVAAGSIFKMGNFTRRMAAWMASSGHPSRIPRENIECPDRRAVWFRS
jgi:hypothetical protein